MGKKKVVSSELIVILQLLRSKHGIIFHPCTSLLQFLHKHPRVLYNTTSCILAVGLCNLYPT